MSTETTETGGDDLRSAITAAMNPEVEEAPEEGLSDSEEKKGRERDESGKFKSKAKEEPKEELEVKEPQKELDPKAEKAETQERIAPPVEWSGKAKVRWERLPREVQEQIAQDYKTVSETRNKSSALEQILEPRRHVLTANYGTLEQGVNYLFQMSDFAEKDPKGFIQWFAQQRGIALSNDAPRNEQSADPHLSTALQKIQTLEQTLQGLQSNIQNQSTSSLQAQIEAFASDPKHPYFNDVRNHMAALMQGGVVKTMEEAYESACFANPVIRQQLEADRRENEELERKKKAEASRKAAGSIGGSPEGNPSHDEPASTLREELLRNMRASRV